MTAAQSHLAPDAPTQPRSSQRERVNVSQDISAALAHELRNPVFALASAAQLLRYRITDDPVIEKNIGRIMRHTAPVLVEWLARQEIPYDELHFGKPWCGHDGFYVDDRAIRPREFVTLDLAEIETLIRKDRLCDE